MVVSEDANGPSLAGYSFESKSAAKSGNDYGFAGPKSNNGTWHVAHAGPGFAEVPTWGCNVEVVLRDNNTHGRTQRPERDRHSPAHAGSEPCRG